jgi:hypothetical protein
LKNKSNRNSGTSNNDGQGERFFNSNDVAFIIIAMKNDFANDLWILDSETSCHYCRTVVGLTDVKEIDESIKIGNDDLMKATKIGNLKCEVIQINGEKFTVTLNNVKYVPSLCVILFSLNKALKKGFKVSNDGVVVSLNFKHVKLTFERVINATDGCVTGVSMKSMIRITSTDLPMHQSAMKGFTISIICISCLDIAAKKYSTKRSKCMYLSPLVVLIHVSNVQL